MSSSPTIYQPPGSRRERILLFGGFGTGKSEAATRVLERALHPEARLWITDTERAYEALVDLDDHRVEFTDLTLEDWPAYVENANRTAREGDVDDWWVVDSATNSWEVVQQYALDQGWESDQGGVDWVRVNREHMRLYRAYLSFRGHLLLTGRSKELARPQKSGKSMESRQTVETYGAFGVKPAGQKDLGHVPPHTVLLMGKTKAGEWTITTVKDRKRAELDREPVRDFVRDYLVRVAGWRSLDGAKDAGKGDAGKGDAGKGDAGKGDARKGDAGKGDEEG